MAGYTEIGGRLYLACGCNLPAPGIRKCSENIKGLKVDYIWVYTCGERARIKIPGIGAPCFFKAP